MTEHAALRTTSAHLEVLADLAAIKAAQARGEHRGIRYVRVERNAATGARRVVPATLASTPRRTMADRVARLERAERSLATDRARRLEQAEREACTPTERRERRLAAAQAAVDLAFVRDRISPTLLPSGFARVRWIW